MLFLISSNPPNRGRPVHYANGGISNGAGLIAKLLLIAKSQSNPLIVDHY